MIAESAGGTTWCLDNDAWTQDGHRFDAEQLDGLPVPSVLTDLDYLAGARTAPGDAGFLPRQFKFSPFDGSPLPDIRSQNWLPPCASSQGNRICDEDAGAALAELVGRLTTHWRTTATTMQSSAVRVDAPASNGLLYIASDAGGHRDALFALGRSGSLWIWQRHGQRWVQLRASKLPLARHRFDHWASAVVALPAATGSGLVIANDAGADFVQIDPLRMQYSVNRCEGTAMGTPGRLGDAALVPLHAGGRAQIAMHQQGRWNTLPVEGDVPAQMPLLAAPVVVANGHGLAWIGELGWLQVQENGENIDVRWHGWPSGMQARPILSPPYRNGDGDWQLLQREDKSTVSVLLGASLPHENPLRRASAGTGASTFQLNVRVDRPWADYDPDDHPDASDNVIHPFLEIEQNGMLMYLRVPNERRTSLLSFYENRGRQQASYCIGWPAFPNQTYTLDAAEPWNAQWFMHDDALWLWIDDRGTLLRWSVR